MKTYTINLISFPVGSDVTDKLTVEKRIEVKGWRAALATAKAHRNGGNANIKCSAYIFGKGFVVNN